MAVSENEKIMLLFDVDGTLTRPRMRIEQSMKEFLEKVRKVVSIGVVGGSDLVKIVDQLGDNLNAVLEQYDYVFAENGLVGYSESIVLPTQSIKMYLGEEKLKRLINFTLKYFSEIDLPVKRGNFVEFRNGMLNLSPIGRSCSQEERAQFVEYDSMHRVREVFVNDLMNFTKGWDLKISIGGQISVDVFPKGWDKTFCLQYLQEYSTIHFFGDRTDFGGNDHEIFVDSRTIGHSVINPKDTKRKVEDVLRSMNVGFV